MTSIYVIITLIVICTSTIVALTGKMIKLILRGQREICAEIDAARVEIQFIAGILTLGTKYKTPEEILREDSESQL